MQDAVLKNLKTQFILDSTLSHKIGKWSNLFIKDSL